MNYNIKNIKHIDGGITRKNDYGQMAELVCVSGSNLFYENSGLLGI